MHPEGKIHMLTCGLTNFWPYYGFALCMFTHSACHVGCICDPGLTIYVVTLYYTSSYLWSWKMIFSHNSSKVLMAYSNQSVVIPVLSCDG